MGAGTKMGLKNAVGKRSPADWCWGVESVAEGLGKREKDRGNPCVRGNGGACGTGVKRTTNPRARNESNRNTEER